MNWSDNRGQYAQDLLDWSAILEERRISFEDFIVEREEDEEETAKTSKARRTRETSSPAA